MKIVFAAAAIASILALAAPRASAQQQSGAFQCIASSSAGGNVTLYVTGMMPGDANQRAAFSSAWSAYVHATYPQQTISTAVCNPTSGDPAIQQRVLAAEQNAWQRANMQVVNVNWQPGQQNKPAAQNPNTNPYAAAEPPKDAGAKDGPPADAKDAAPPADAGPQPRASYCYSDEKKPTIYFSDAFDTADLPSAQAYANAFAHFLAGKYSYKGTVTCKDQDTIFNAQGAIRDEKDTLSGKQTVDTDWTYEPPAPGAAPADAPADTPAPKKATHASH
jgi:hypothetical protein